MRSVLRKAISIPRSRRFCRTGTDYGLYPYRRSDKNRQRDIDDLSGRGIYSAQTAGCTFDAQKNFTGKMPNQPVTVVYTYEIDPSYVTHVTINRIDNHNNVLAEPETRRCLRMKQ